MSQATPIDEDLKEQILQRYLSTPKGRQKLIEATIRPAKDLLFHAKEHPAFVDTSSFTPSVHKTVQIMERIQANLDGTEVFDRVQFEKLFGDLKALYETMPSDEPPSETT